jgi:hypothetical protein
MSLQNATIHSSDKKEIKIPLHLAIIPNMIKQQYDEDIPTNEIQEFFLLNVHSTILEKYIIPFLYLYENEPMHEIQKPLFSKNLNIIVQQKYVDFINNIVDENHLCRIFESSNYIDLKPLMDLVSVKIKLILLEKTPEQQRIFFSNIYKTKK